MILDSLIHFAISLVNSIVGAIISYFAPNYQSKTEQVRNYIRYGLYALVGWIVLSFAFLINLLIGWCIHSAMISGLRLQHEGIEFEMAFLPGQNWDFEDEFYIDEKQSKSFFSRKHEDDDDFNESFKEFLYESSKRPQKRSIKQRCVQTATKHVSLLGETHYSAALVLTLPETHHERVQANTALRVKHATFTRTRPIPTPTRSSILATTRTLLHLPLLLLGIVPETNEVEVNLWGGDSPSMFASVDEPITFTIESCKLQILRAHLIITPHLSIVERLLTRFPLLAILSFATLLQAVSILFCSGLALYFLYPNMFQSLFQTNTAVHDLPVPSSEKLTRQDSWSQLDDDEESD